MIKPDYKIRYIHIRELSHAVLLDCRTRKISLSLLIYIFSVMVILLASPGCAGLPGWVVVPLDSCSTGREPICIVATFKLYNRGSYSLHKM